MIAIYAITTAVNTFSIFLYSSESTMVPLVDDVEGEIRRGIIYFNKYFVSL